MMAKERKCSFPWELGTQAQMSQMSHATESWGERPAWHGLCLRTRSFNLETMRHLQEGCVLARFLNMERKRAGFQDCWGAFFSCPFWIAGDLSLPFFPLSFEEG